VTFQLKDPALNLKDKLGFVAEKNVLKVAVNAPQTRPAVSPQGKATEELLREMESRIAGDSSTAAPAAAGAGASVAAPATRGTAGPAAVKAAGATAEVAPAAGGAAASGGLALGDLSGNQFFYSLATMVIALTIIVGGLYGVLLLYNRFLAGRLRRFTGAHSIRQVASFHIGPRQRIVVLDINDEVIACGVTPSQITYLTHLGGKGPVGRAPAGSEGGLPGADPSAGAKALGVLGQEPKPPAPSDPVHQFAEVLKQKVRSLKRIN
jgi:flagellar biogenesis protein FliO